jgi:Fic family protein
MGIMRQKDRQNDPEPIGLMEPMLPAEGSSRTLNDLVVDLVAKSNALAGQMHPIVRESIGHLVRSMNCYYSNLIEGHNTHPRDIDRALAKDYSEEPKKRNLQKEAVAHIEVQAMIDSGNIPDCYPASSEFVLWLHKEFCSRLPDELLQNENPDTKEIVSVIPGELRHHDVSVGRHIPPRPDSLPSFMTRFDEAYDVARLGKSQQIISAAAAHHRLLWIHPFLDGNGRVTRLMSHAMLLRFGVGSSLWSVARGLARNVQTYKSLLQAADEPRRGDLDGRGTLSEQALTEFCEFFLKACIDQVDYMASLIQPTELTRRMKLYVDDEVSAGRLPQGSFSLLREALLFGEFERGRAPELTGYKDRMARTILSELLKKGLLVSDTPKSSVRLAFPFEVVERWFPALYPDAH